MTQTHDSSKIHGSDDSDAWTLTQQHVAAGCLQGVMSALHPELKRFVRVCVREHVLKGTPMRNAMTPARSSEIDRNVTALLDAKLSAAADFAAYLQFADQHWHQYVADLDFHGDLRDVLRQSLEIRHKVARQVAMRERDVTHALTVLRRLSELIAVQQTTNDLIQRLIEASVMNATDSIATGGSTDSSRRLKPRSGASVQVWIIVLLCWVVLALLWVIALLQDEHTSQAARTWLPRFAFWDVPLSSFQLTPEPVAPEPASVWSLLTAFVPAPTPAPTPVPEPIASSWFSWQ